MLGTIGLAVVLFVTTNIDDVFILLGFFADPKVRTRQIVAGQYLGIAALVAVSLVASLISLVLAPAYVGLLGLIPVALGLKELYELRQGADDDDDEPARTVGLGNIAAVAAVTIANGGDNIGVYTPVFATANAAELATICLVFAAMIAVLLAAAHWLVHHPALGAPIRRYAPIVVPCVLIGVGVWVLYESGSFSLLGT